MLNRGFPPPDQTPPNLRSKGKFPTALKIAGIYLVIGSLWIFFSDRLLNIFLNQRADAITNLQTVKGWFYIVTTAFLLYWLIDREIRANQLATRKLQKTLAELLDTRRALQDSQALFSAFMDYSPVASWVTDSQGTVEYVSRPYTQMFQAPLNAVGQNIFDLYPHSLAQTALNQIQAVVNTGQVVQAIEPGIRADGRLGEFMVYRFPLPQPDGKMHVGGVAIEVTEWKQAEAALIRSEEQLRLAFDFAQIGSWDWDLQTNQFTWNQNHFRLLGLNPDTVAATYDTWCDRIHPDDFARIEALLDQALTTQAPYIAEYRVIHPNGHLRWLVGRGRAIYDETGHPTRMVGVVLDITDRKQAELALQESETRFRQLAENIQEVFWMANVDFTQLLYVSPAYESVWGRSRADLYEDPTSFIAAIHPDDRDHALTIMQHHRHQGWDQEYRIIRPDGTVHWIWEQAFPVIDLREESKRVVGICQDVSDRKRLEQALRQQAERLELTITISQRIRQSLNLKEILNTTVVEVKHWLQADRVVVYQFAKNGSGTIVAESVTAGWPIVANSTIRDTCFQNGTEMAYQQGKTRAIANIYDANFSACHLRFLEQFEVKASLIVPIMLGYEESDNQLWGLLIAHQCEAPHEWHLDQLALLEQIALQLAIAIQQAQVFQQAQTELVERQQAEMHLRAALTEKDVLLKEIHHRVKNNLQIVSGLLQLQAQSFSDPEIVNALRESQNRVESMSLIHKKLYTAADLGQIDVADYIQSLAMSLLTTYQISPGRIDLQVEVKPVTLSLDQAIPCGLIINELVSNALKYAFPNHRSGEITIRLYQSNTEFELIVQDNGIGLPEDLDWKNTQSLGLSLVYALATDQLDGSLKVDCSQGTRFTIGFSQGAAQT